MDVAWKDAHVSETSLTEAVGLIRQAPEKDDLGMCEDCDRVAADDFGRGPGDQPSWLRRTAAAVSRTPD